MSPQTKSQSLHRRSSRTLPATILAILLLVVAALATWIGIVRITTGAWPEFLSSIRQYLAALTWGSPEVWAAAIILALLGLILFLAAILPGKRNAAKISAVNDAAGDGRWPETAMSGRGLARLAVAHVNQMDGVDSGSVRATAKKIDVQVKTPLRESGNLSERLKSSLEDKLNRVGLDPVPRIVVRVRTTND